MLLLVGTTVFLVLSSRRLMAGWMANQGAVLMARVQLADFPSHQWEDGQDLSRLAPAQAWLERAVHLDPASRTANHRLGLIALQRRDFTTATRYLEAALHLDPSHYGVIKNLGYAYVWAGQYDQAQPLLAQIPEAKQELHNYNVWWQAQGRADLAHQAQEMRTRLAGGTTRPATGFEALLTGKTFYSSRGSCL